MKIGFDAKRLFLNYTGLGNYSRAIVKDLQKYYPEHEYHLYTTKVLKNTDTEAFFNQSKFVIHENSSLLNSYWRSRTIVRDLERDGIDVFHGLSAELPIGIKSSRVKSVVTIHDLIFRYYKSDYNVVDRFIYNFKSKYACNNADKIVSISDFTKNDIVNSYGINDEKIVVVYLQISDRFTMRADEDKLKIVKRKFDLPNRFFLYVGSVIGRKNLKLVLKAMFNIDKKSRIPLVVVGSGKKYMEEVKQLVRDRGLVDSIIFLKDIDNEALPIIYQLAEFFVFPSLYEGFGLPVLEAIQSGKKCIVSEETSLVEVVGDCGLVLKQNDIEAMKNAIEAMIQSPAGIIDCTKHLAKFDPELISSKIMGIYKSLISI